MLAGSWLTHEVGVVGPPSTKSLYMPSLEGMRIRTNLPITWLEMDRITSEYNEREERFFELYTKKKYAEARDIIEQMLKDYPEKAGTLYNYTYCTRNLAGDTEGALDLMEEAAKKGYWSDPEQLAGDSDLQNLSGNPRFREVLKRYSELAEESRRNSEPALRIIEPAEGTHKSGDPVPLVMALHGNNQSADDAVEDWKFMSEKGWLVALPQSSQISMPGAYVWNDLSVAIPEIGEHFDQIRKDYRVDPDRTIVAGFSKGGALAAKVCFEQVVPCRRFVLMGPYLGDLDGIKGMVEEFSPGRGKGFILVGENDSDCIDGASNLHRMLLDKGVDCKLDVIPGLGHAYPGDFSDRLAGNLGHLLEKLD